MKRQGCLWWCAIMALACLVLGVVIAVVALAACAAAGVGLWFLVRYCWRKLAAQAPDSRFVQKASALPPIVRQAGTGLICAIFSLTLMAGLVGPSSAATSQVAETQQAYKATRKQKKTSKQTEKTAAEKDAAAPDDDAKVTETSSNEALADLTVKFLDVGQGDASLIEFPDGRTMLIDTPTDESQTVTSELARDGRASIDWMVATHPDADHVGGLAGVINAVEVKSVWAPEANSPTQTYTTFLTTVGNKGLGIEAAYAGRQIASGDNYSIDILWPQQNASYGESNDYSAVIRIAYGETTFLFTGDAPVEAQSRCVDGHVDVLKVSHHGSASGMSAALAAKLSPAVAVLSYGKNSYGHPTQVVLDALASVNAQVLGTRVNGTVTVTSNGRDVSASVAREGSVVAASQDAGASSQGLGTSGGGGGSSGGSAAAASAASEATADDAADGDETVVITQTGEKYHRSSCRTLTRSRNLTETTKSQAQAAGLTACSVCNP